MIGFGCCLGRWHFRTLGFQVDFTSQKTHRHSCGVSTEIAENLPAESPEENTSEGR
jgi:hypothetical protein